MGNILVIGGSYFLGRVFVEELSNEGNHAIFVLNRGKRPLRMQGVVEIVCDRHDAPKLAQVVPDRTWDAIVDFCAYGPEDIGTLLESVPGHVRQYVYISTATVHQYSPSLPMTESSPTITGPLTPAEGGDYAYKKWLAELTLRALCESKGIAHVALRPTFIYGTYNYAPRESYFFNLIATDEPLIVPTSPQALFSTVSVWDMARVTIACLGNEKIHNRAFIVCSDELISYDKLIATLEEIVSRKIEVKHKPARVIDAQGIPLPFPLDQHLIYSGAALRDALSYRYMSYLEGMRRTYNWFMTPSP